MKAITIIVACLGLLAGCGRAGPEVDFSPDEVAKISQYSPVGPVPADVTNRVSENAGAARLGQLLFYDTRLSGNGQVSCATCHNPAHGWADGKPIAEGIGRAKRHSPTLWNTAFNRWFFWDGRADSQWAQAVQPIENPVEQGGNRLQIAHLVYDDPVLKAAYEKVFGALPDLGDAQRFPARGCPVPDNPSDPLRKAWASMSVQDQGAINRLFTNLTKAIAAYERQIVSRNAPFDRFVEGLHDGDTNKIRALSPAAQRGLKTFIGRGNCGLCHSGPQFTNGEFHNTGLPPIDGSSPDGGRFDGIRLVLQDPFNATSAYSDDPNARTHALVQFLQGQRGHFGEFKTPTLRNVAETAPYMHDGRFPTLEEVVRFYSTRDGAVSVTAHDEIILRPLHLSDSERADLIEFLKSLTGEPLDPALTHPLS